MRAEQCPYCGATVRRTQHERTRRALVLEEVLQGGDYIMVDDLLGGDLARSIYSGSTPNGPWYREHDCGAVALHRSITDTDSLPAN